mgnify:CR=1 FL=1|tara:strand:- start:2776 stop:3369 length:594 start_codon:yes stop_codon:yes gene_type:complete
MAKTKKQSVPDPTRGKTRLIWEPTYAWTTEFLKEHPDLKVGAEIGVAGGQHLKAIMEETEVEKMYGVDPYITESWDMHECFNVDEDYGSFDGLYGEVRDMLSQYGDRVELIRKKSTDAAPDFEDGCLDFVFIDAFHDYENCYNDIAFWHHRVREGGYVMGHDWEHGSHPGVQKAVVEHYGDAVTGIPEPVHVWYIQV